MKTTVKQAIIAFLRTRGKKVFFLRNSTIETKVPQYAKETFNIKHSPGTYSRAFRLMREDNIPPKGILITEAEQSELPQQLKNSIEKIFIVRIV